MSKMLSAAKRVLLSTRINAFWMFLLVFFISLIHVSTSKYSVQYYDSENYWFLAKSFDSENGFSLYGFKDSLRGYFFPLLHYPFVVFSRCFLDNSNISVIKFIGCIYAGVTFGFAAPKLWEKVSGGYLYFWQKVLFSMLCLYFWRDYFNFFLSDFPAILALLLALISSYYNRNILYVFCAGALVAASVYCRPIYLLAVPFVLLLVLHTDSMQQGVRRYADKALRLVILVIAFLCVGYPQYLINKKNFDSSKILPLGESEGYKVGSSKDLYLWQLNQGLQIQRYETNVGNQYSKLQVVFVDQAGSRMLRENYLPELGSYAEYFSFAWQHNADIACLYARHLFNGLDLLYTSPYVKNIYQSNIFLSWLLYSVIFIALCLSLKKITQLSLHQWLVLGALLIVCAASVPIVVETRFFLPLHLLLYAIACFGWPSRLSLKQQPAEQWLKYGLVYLVFLLGCFTLSSSVQATLELGPRLLTENQVQ
ncbi:hypothetical protein [Hymenobacter psychrotolerans]|uniref:Dolichyl-phosphate-mannose-protein mannosyltransferase n=1 Tax=Hymenobacter psychrotolerans DSM 18569 TaxID=1121959 RepID=A0A1M6PSK7_9BACT|nr:hypothetical protein [Hymenobacter psychrotolerans]SHK10890.1 hypothetical protein SAMN02746009_00327 [Hymenobacter psychrotolerans DSM 18569]